MKKDWKKQMQIAALTALVSLSLAGCSGEKKPEQTADLPEAAAAAGEEGNPVQEPETPEQPEEVQKKDPEGTAPEQEPDSSQAAESLTGDIREVGEQTFTVAKALEEESEDGGDILTVPVGDGSLEETDLVTVSYDESTAFEKQTIWDGGAKHEETQGSAQDLEKGRMVVMSGYYEGQVFHAVKVRVVEVVL